MTHFRLLLLTALLITAACDGKDPVGIGSDYDPRDLDARYTWILERWDQGVPEGQPVVKLTWGLPNRFEDQSFRVYSRGSSGGYILIATVTSCSQSLCRYSDVNLVPGETYDYYVATVDERTGEELGISEAISVEVPDPDDVAIPETPTVTSLDRAVFLRWSPSGAQRYLILTEDEGGDAFLIGETDGTSFLDDRATNGARHRYYIAGVDVNDHVSGLSQPVDAFPRPDYHAEILTTHTSNPATSGFRFVNDPETENPVLSGSSPDAQWRLVESGGGLQIEPLGSTRITEGVFTTALACGAGSEPDCEDIRIAPSDGSFGTAAVAVRAAHTYVLRVTDSSGGVHFAKVRVQGETVNSQEERVIVFDWAYQTRTNERTLNLVPR